MSTLIDRLLGYQASGLSPGERATHTYVIGQSGTGKSRALESWIMQDVRAGRGVGVIDPHGDLFHNLLARIAMLHEVADRVILFDPLDTKWLVGFNPLQKVAGLAPERLAIYLTDVVIKVWKLKPEEAPRMLWLLVNSILALIELELTLPDLPRWLLDAEFRERLLPRLAQKEVVHFFREEYPSSPAAMHQWATPILNKLGQLLFDPDMRQIFSSPSSFDFRDLMHEGRILLVNVPKGILGEGLSTLVAAFVVAHIQKAALARASSQRRQPFYLYLDEFQNYTTDNIQDILSESRKYALSLTLAHQYLEQLPSQLRAAVLNTAGTLVSFRVGYRDGHVLAREIFPDPAFLAPSPRIRIASQFAPFRLQSKGDPSEGWDALGRELSGLDNRLFWTKVRNRQQPRKLSSYWMPDVASSQKLNELVQALRDHAGQRFAQPRADLGSQFKQSQNGHEADLPLWSG